MAMKIGILTQPLHNNYGGLLQAYALQHFLREEGHTVMTVDFSTNKRGKLSAIRSTLAGLYRRYIKRQRIPCLNTTNNSYKRLIGQNTNRFTAQYIIKTQPIYEISEFSYIKKYDFDAYIVGSDQVWRPSYSAGLDAFFLSFLDESNSKVRKIAYAASFGVDHCDEFSDYEICKYSRLLRNFHAIGVREDSAVSLCEKKFSVKASHVIDPTLLIDKSDYIKIVENECAAPSAGNMMVYVLDMTEDKTKIISKVASQKKLSPFSIMPDEKSGIYPSVASWIRGFIDAEYIVTDSFHGVVFSIIFNKPFIAIGNKGRGLARFTSLLKQFNLETRLIYNFSELTEELINSPINYISLNATKAKLKEDAHLFLKRGLSSTEETL